MPYVINKTNGEPLLNLDDGVLDTSTSVGLLGRNYVGYGETQNENFLHLMENFANTNPPPRPIKGQNWFDTQNNLLKIYNGENWFVIGSAVLSPDQPDNANPGSLWLKLPNKILYVYDGNSWQLIGPETVEGFGTTRCRSALLLDNLENLNPVILLTVNGEIISIISQNNFLISPLNAIEGFTRLFPGLNFKSSTKIYGNLEGVAQKASRLESIRTINGVGFNGESDIVIKSSTEKILKRGTYLVGSDFDGSTESIWSVDAAVDNIIGKIVVRDSTGGFSAGIVKADIIGNLQGNVSTLVGTSNFNIITANQFVGASLSGNANTATRLQVSRKINDVAFNGSQDITITASAQTLTGNSLNSTVTLSNLTQVGTLTSLSVTDNGISIGSGGQLRFNILDQIPTISTTGGNIPLRIRISDTQFAGSSGLDIIPASVSLANGGENITGMIPSASLNIGHPNHVINKIYANNFIGNLAISDNSQPTNISFLQILTTADSVAAGGPPGPALVPHANDIFNVGLPNLKFNNVFGNVFQGVATTAQYADLAEKYKADKSYKPGTVVMFGGEYEITLADPETNKVAGVISTNPAYLMNSKLVSDNTVVIALQGRVPVLVTGKISKGDMLISAGNGYATSSQDPNMGSVIGKSLEDFEGNEGIIEMTVGRM